MIGRQNHRAFVAAGEEHGAGVGVIHLGRVTPHQRKNLHRPGILDLHALDQFAEAVERRALISQQVRGLRHNRTRDDERPGAP